MCNQANGSRKQALLALLTQTVTANVSDLNLWGSAGNDQWVILWTSEEAHAKKKKEDHSFHMFGSTPENRPRLWFPSIRARAELQQCLFVCVIVTVNYDEVRSTKTNNANCKPCLCAYLSIIGQRHQAWRERRERQSGGYHNALVSVNEPFPAKWIIDWLWPGLWSL